MRSKKRMLLCVLAVVCFLLGVYMLTVFTAIRFSGMLFCGAGMVLLLFAGLDRMKDHGKKWTVYGQLYAKKEELDLQLLELMEKWEQLALEAEG